MGLLALQPQSLSDGPLQKIAKVRLLNSTNRCTEAAVSAAKGKVGSLRRRLITTIILRMTALRATFAGYDCQRS